jgi:hypothetical protein
MNSGISSTHKKEDTMRLAVALSAAMLLSPHAAAFAQANIGSAAENRDNGPYGGASSTRLPSNQYYGPYENNGRFVKPNTSLTSSRADRNAFFRSGTRGRMGLGASPLHPEGPGNYSDGN